MSSRPVSRRVSRSPIPSGPSRRGRAPVSSPGLRQALAALRTPAGRRQVLATLEEALDAGVQFALRGDDLASGRGR